MRGGWVYIMANRYRGAMYVGVSADLAARIYAHRQGCGSKFVQDREARRLVWAGHFPTIDEAITFEKRLKRWRRQWKFELIEKANSDWDDLYSSLMG